MPRSRGSEMPQQRQSSPRAPLHLKPTACSEANSIRSPKLEDRRSPRSPLHERKKGSRVADLETKLGQAKEELEKLKEQLASAEAARIDAQKELEETKKHFPVSHLNTAAPDPVGEEKEKTISMEEEKVHPGEFLLLEKDESLPAEEDAVNFPTTDVFEVAPASSEAEGSKLEVEDAEEGTETKAIIEEERSKEEMGTAEKEKQDEEEVLESPEVTELRTILAEKEKQLESVIAENQTFIKEAENAKADSSEWRKKAEEITRKLAEAEDELNKTRMTAEGLSEKLELVDTAKASMDAEMKRLRVQTEQWRKAAEAAASVLVAGDAVLNDGELNGRRLGESGRSMERHLRGYDIGGGGWSPVIAGGEGKRRGVGGGIRMFGELWKKKGQLK